MVKDIKYIIKRILIGVGICLVLSLIRGNLFIMASAQTYGFQSYELCSVGYGCSNGNSLPISQSYANVVYSRSSSVSLLNGHSYSFSYYGVLTGKNISINSGYPIIYVSNSGNNYQRAYPDRYESLYVTYLGSDRYAVSWSFDMDIIGNFNLVDITYYFTSNFQNTSTSVSLIESSIDVTDITDSGSSPSQDIINNNNQNTQNIINNQQNNTQNIINNNNSNTETITNNQNQNTQDIIDNQNSNTEKEIESQQVCRFIDKQDILEDNKFLTINGVIFSANDDGITDYIPISNSKIKVINKASTRSNSSCFYNINKELISCINNNNDMSNNTYLTIPENSSYFRATINKSSNKPTFEICTSGNQAIVDSQNNINNSLNDDSGVNDSDIDDLFGDIRGNSSSPVSDLLTLPITLLQAYLDGMSGSCSPYTLGTLYGTTLVLPCIDIPGIIGTSLWNVVDALFCLYMIYNIAMMCISIYESFTSLDDSMQLLYSPQHSGHTRVSRNEGEY